MDQAAATPAVDVLVTALGDQKPGVVIPALLVRDRLRHPQAPFRPSRHAPHKVQGVVVIR